MNRLFFSALFMLLLSSMIYGQSNDSVIFGHPICLEEGNSISESVYLEITKQGEYFEIKIINTHTDTIYLFDSYLVDDLVYSKYLHRTDKKKKMCKVSFVPIIPYLSVEKADVVILGKERIIMKDQVLYSFRIIPPKTYFCIKINRSVFENIVENILDFDTKKFTKFDNPRFKTVSEVKCTKRLLEFAFFNDISLLADKKAYYLNEFNFNKQAQSYEILSINLPE